MAAVSPMEVADHLRDALRMLNACEEYPRFARGVPGFPYGDVQSAFVSVLTAMFGARDAETIHEACLDSGESVSSTVAELRRRGDIEYEPTVEA